MRFLLDQDVYSITGLFLSDLGHDVVRVAEIGMAAASDEDLLTAAHDQNRIMWRRLSPRFTPARKRKRTAMDHGRHY